jgi:hypothetical protein
MMMEQAGRTLKTGSRMKLIGAVAALMVIPVVALRAMDDVEWDPGDAVFLAILLTGITLALEVAARVPGRLAFAAGIGLALLAGLLQIWVNLAVGIIGSEDNPINLMYAAVVAIAVTAAALTQFEAEGMKRAMVAAAAAQGATFFIALGAGFGFTGPITIFFVSLWLIAAWLFRRAAEARPIRR